MILLAIKLLLAHLIGDFLFQPDTWVTHKKEHKIKSKYLYWHIAIHLTALLILLQFQYTLAIVFIILTHFIIDVIKIYLTNQKNSRLLFVSDQIAHVVVLLGVVYYYFPFKIDINTIYTQKNLLFITFLLLVTYVSSVLIKQLISKWDAEINNDKKSIDGAGNYIGMLERLLVFIFVLLNLWSAIGFLITAKSVFRFGDLTDGKNRKLTEYVLIGTLLSFGLAIILGILYKYLITLEV
tara:strand:+ start:461064 stop:461777 length:714 start_codon:yes stop_codon:yes gene_type:complete